MNDELIFDDDDLFEEFEESTETEEPVQEQPEEDLTTEVLRLKGIADPSKIKFEDETGAIIERDWNSLSREEQLNILHEEPQESNDLTDEEIQLLNAIRGSGLSVTDYIAQNREVVEAPISYKIDELSDEDVYALDILEKVGSENITDEEIAEAINTAKQNEKLFKMTVDGLRAEYKRLEEDEKIQEANALASQQQAAYQEFSNSIQNEIRNLNSFAGSDLELSDEDVNDLAAFMLELDDSGTSAFGRALQDPALFTKAAFWLLNEDQIVEELSKQMQDTYKRGYEAGKADSKSASKLAFSPKKQKETSNDDFFVDDDEW